MHLMAAPYLAAALLLIVAGVAKAIDPLSLARALRTAGVPLRGPVLTQVVRVVAVAEAVIGGAAVVVPGRLPALAVALSYAGFTTFVLRALRSGSPLASCGCFGKTDTPPTRTHVAVTAALSVAAVAVAVSPQGPPVGFALLVVTGVLAYLTYLILAVLPLTSAASR
jgi:hypothetical protein